MIRHRNRRGDLYYLHEGKTKTGKAKYFFSRKRDGTLVTTVPAGFEVYESPNAQVLLRKTIPCLVTSQETTMVFDAVRQNAKAGRAVVETKGDKVTVFMPDTDVDEAVADLADLSPHLDGERVRSVLERNMLFSPMMRFVLLDEKTREYQAERWCFSGSIDDWISIGTPGPLPKLARQFCRHLGKESFFELM